MGSIGKTTMMGEFVNRAKKYNMFNAYTKATFTESTDTPLEVNLIQGKLASYLGLPLEEGDTQVRVNKIHQRLSEGTKSVLVILDNVWETTSEFLWEVGIPPDDPNKCKTFLFNDMDTKLNFNIPFLSKEDAWNLFKKRVGDSIDTDVKLHPIAQEVLDECGGLPVAISIVGSALYGKHISHWRSALRQLQQTCPENIPGVIKDVYGKIEFSYECLSQEAKLCFVMCCLLPESEDISIEHLICSSYGLKLFKGIDSIVEARDHVQSLVDTLKSRCLLLDGDKKWCVKMHDVVHDVAEILATGHIIQEKNEQLGKRIVLTKGVELEEWRKNSGVEKSTYCNLLTTNVSIELLLLEFRPIDGTRLIELPATNFNGLEHPKVLLIWSEIDQSFNYNYIEIRYFPRWKNLQTLMLEHPHRRSWCSSRTWDRRGGAQTEQN